MLGGLPLVTMLDLDELQVAQRVVQAHPRHCLLQPRGQGDLIKTAQPVEKGGQGDVGLVLGARESFRVQGLRRVGG